MSSIHRLHQHRSWVNRNLLATASTLSEEHLRSPFKIGQGSIWMSLTHLYAAEYVWLDALRGIEDSIVPGDVAGKLPGNQEGEGGITSLVDLREKWEQLDQRWKSYLESLTLESLDEIVYRKSVALGQRIASLRSDVLLHVCTHAHYTAAQVMNMFRQVGVKTLPETMLISMARHGTSGGTPG